MRVAGRVLRFGAWLVALASLAACDTAPPLPLYAEPPGLTQENAATLRGSRINHGLIVPDSRIFVSGVDNQSSGFRPDDYDKPLRLSAGSHVVDILLVQANKVGQVATEVQLDAGKTYLVACRQGVFAFTVPCTITEQESKTKVADVLMRLNDGSLFPVLMRGGK
jgi:hypothetical protein